MIDSGSSLKTDADKNNLEHEYKVISRRVEAIEVIWSNKTKYMKLSGTKKKSLSNEYDRLTEKLSIYLLTLENNTENLNHG